MINNIDLYYQYENLIEIYSVSWKLEGGKFVEQTISGLIACINRLA